MSPILKHATACGLAVLTAATPAVAAPFMVVGNDEKPGTGPDGKPVVNPIGKDTVQIIDRATSQLVGELPSGGDPETFALGPSGNPLLKSHSDL